MRLILLATFLLALTGTALAQETPPPPEPTPPAPCGGETVTITRMQWPSAELLAEIHARLIRQSFNCTVEIVPGDLRGFFEACRAAVRCGP